jgi:uncharacterized protein (TIGR04255 family)
VQRIPDPRHPNSPLVEVVCEIRFPGETVIECRRHKIQDQIRAEYPNLLVPAVRPGAHVGLDPYRFEREDGSAGVMVALNRFGYYSREYPGFDAFRIECLRIMGLFATVFPVKKLNRVGLRHINIIPFARENGFIPIEDFFVLGDKLLEVLPNRFGAFNIAFVLPIEDGTITTRIESINKDVTKQEALLLDFDFAKTGELFLSRMDDYLDKAHEKSASLFRQLTTQRYRGYICGEEL